MVQTEAADVPIYQEFVGQVFGLKDIAIRARVEGFLEGIHFREGSRGKKGQLLYTMESQPFEAEVAAKMSMVAEAKAMLAKAKSDLGRIKPLAAEKAVSQSDLDGAVARYEAAIASVKAAQAANRLPNSRYDRGSAVTWKSWKPSAPCFRRPSRPLWKLST